MPDKQILKQKKTEQCSAFFNAIGKYRLLLYYLSKCLEVLSF